jgi:outer membrane receptor protein involved in Fe transport
LNWEYRGGAYNSLLQMSHAKTLSTYSYDEDWSYVGIAPGWEYSSFDQYQRDRSMSSAEWRLQSDTPSASSWALGFYAREESEALRRDYTYLSSPFHSDIDTLTTALFGQINHDLNRQLAGFVGARVEQRDSDYADSVGVDRSFDLSYWTGRAGLTWQYQSDQQLYVTVSRGARAGGPNARLLASIDALPEANQAALSRLGTFEEETLLSVELGWVTFWSAFQLRSQLTLFAMDRQDQQAKASLVIPRSDGSTAFIDYTDNAASGKHHGLEWEATWRPFETLTWRASIGLLDAYFDDYISATGEDLSGRSQPQAPEWQYSLGATWALNQRVSLHLEAVGSDDYFFSDRHTVQARETHQINANLSGELGSWQWTLWARNLTDSTTFTRGFGTFGNDPRKEYRLEAYRQYGEPRVMGFTLHYRFMERPK